MSKSKLSTVELRETFFMELYKKAFPIVARYIARMGGSLAEAEDIFQDTLVTYFEKVETSHFVVNEKTYLLGIAKKKWLQYHNSVTMNQPLIDFDIEAVPDEQPIADKLMRYLESAGKKCMELLKACYYERIPVEQIVPMFGYSGKHSATVAKYKCLEKVRETIKENSLNYADFIE